MKKDLSSAKERVKEALKREQEERNGPRKRRLVCLFVLPMHCVTRITEVYIVSFHCGNRLLRSFLCIVSKYTFHCFRTYVRVLQKSLAPGLVLVKLWRS